MHVHTLRPSTRTSIYMMMIIKLKTILSKTMADCSNLKVESLASRVLSLVQWIGRWWADRLQSKRTMTCLRSLNLDRLQASIRALLWSSATLQAAGRSHKFQRRVSRWRHLRTPTRRRRTTTRSRSLTLPSPVIKCPISQSAKVLSCLSSSRQLVTSISSSIMQTSMPIIAILTWVRSRRKFHHSWPRTIQVTCLVALTAPNMTLTN